MRPRGSPNHPRRLFGRPRVPLEHSQGGFVRLLGLSRDAPERSWAPLGYLLGCLGVYLCVVLDDFCAPWQCPRRNSGKLDFDDRLNENAMFSSFQGLQNEPKMVPKRSERRKKSRESTEKRKKYADERLQRARRRSRADRRPPGGGRKSGALICRHRADLVIS